MPDVIGYTEFWVACAAAGPVLLIPAYLVVRQQRAPGSTVRSGLDVGSVAFLAAATIFALAQLSDGTPVHGGLTGRIIEMILIGSPVSSLALSLILDGFTNDRRHGDPPKFDEAGLPEVTS